MRFIVFRPMLRHRMIVLLLLLEIGIALALVLNSLSVLLLRYEVLSADTGLAEDQVLVVEIGREDKSSPESSDLVSALHALALLPDTEAVGTVNALPLMGSEWPLRVSTEAAGGAQAEVGQYVASPGTIAALGLAVTSGRSFEQEDYVPFDSVLPSSAVALVSQSLADELYPAGKALGARIYVGQKAFTVIGTIDALSRPSVVEPANMDLSIVLPALPSGTLSRYIVLKKKGSSSQSSISDLSRTVGEVAPGAFVRRAEPYITMKHRLQKRDWYVFSVMLCVAIVALLTSIFGVYALSSLWINQRSHGLALRRVLGATARDITSMVLIENLAVCALGCLIGLIIAFAMNALIAATYPVAPFDARLIILSVAAILISSLISTLPIAKRVARVEPAEALRRANP